MKIAAAALIVVSTFSCTLYAAAAQPAAPKPDTTAKTTPPAPAKAAESETGRQRCDEVQNAPLHIYFPANTADQSELNELVTSIRNIASPCDKILLNYSKKAVVVRAAPSDIPAIEQILHDTDRPKKTYRLSFTFAEMDGQKHIADQRFSTVVVDGQDNSIKVGSKIPIATGSGAALQTNFTYLDVGTNINTTLVASGTTASLKFNIDQTSVAPEPSTSIPGQPIVRQASFRGESLLSAGKPLLLGSIDVPGSTRRFDIEATIIPLP